MWKRVARRGSVVFCFNLSSLSLRIRPYKLLLLFFIGSHLRIVGIDILDRLTNLLALIWLSSNIENLLGFML